jgi:hypothetical protein
MKSEILFSLLFLTITTTTVMSQSFLSGTYELRGIHDLASAFHFNKDKTFDFYYLYGAVDRVAKGSYEIVADTVKLKSDKVAGKDFDIKLQKKQGNGYHLVFKAPNVQLLRRIKCIGFKGTAKMEYETDKDGVIDIPNMTFDKLYVQHLLFPDIVTQIKDEKNTNNYFELALKPSLSEVSFKGIDLVIQGDELHMLPNYFMQFRDIVYRKSND